MEEGAFDVSTAAGSGSIMVVGPPGCGKSFAVLKYLHDRSRPHARGKRLRSDASASTTHHVHVSYHPLKALPDAQRQQPLQHLLRCVMQELFAGRDGAWGTRRGGGAGDVNTVMFGYLVQHYFRCQPEGSQLHIVLDDVDGSEAGQIEAVDALLSCTTRLPPTAHVFVWVLARAPIPLSSCTRLHFISKPSTATLASWLTVHGGTPPSSSPCDVLVQAALHFSSRKPMSSSVMTSDPRWLLQSVADTLPTLTATAQERGKVNELDLSKAWSVRGGGTSTASAIDVIVDGVRQLGATATLLCVAVFYCGAVAPNKDRVVFGEEWDSQRRGAAAAHTEAVLTSTAHVVLRKRLLAVYRHLAVMAQDACGRCGDTAASPVMAASHLRNLVDWGLISPTGRGDTFHSHVTLSAATTLAQDLGLQLLDLIPTR